MLTLTGWHLLTRLGDSSVMLRTGLLIVAWMLWKREWRWPLALLAVMVLTVTSKVLYFAFGIGIHAIDFRGFSGHSQMSAVILPLLLAGLGSDRNSAWRLFGLGAALALLVGISRLQVNAHTPSEVIGGLALGYAACLITGRRAVDRWLEAPVLWRMAAVLVTLWYALNFVPAPTQGIIYRFSMALAKALA